MFNTETVSKHLKEIGKYPHTENRTDCGLKITMENGQLIFSGGPSDLIDMADLLVSLALSGQNHGQHWHIDQLRLIAEDSPIDELVLGRND